MFIQIDVWMDWTRYSFMDKSYLVLLLVLKLVNLHTIKWLTQIYIYFFIKTSRDVWIIHFLTNLSRDEE